MRGKRVSLETDIPLTRIFTLLLLTGLILSSMQVAFALPMRSTSSYEPITKYEKSPEMPVNHLLGNMAQWENIPANQNPAFFSSILIKMKATEFDPLIEEPRLPSNLVYSVENGYYMVQCFGPIQSHWIEEIKASGALILGYIPDYAYILKMEEGVKEKIENLPFIRWIGIYHPAYKTPRGLIDKKGEIELNVLVFRDRQENLFKVRNSIRALGGAITHDGEDNHIIRTRIDTSKIRNIAFIPEVEWFDEYSPPKAMMINIREFTGANIVEIKGFNGSGIVGEVKDDGIDQNHPDFDGRLIGTVGSPPDAAHGTCAFGVVFSSGENVPVAK